ncbi:MAG: CoA transferase [Planctomycetota bacterium]
MTSGALSHLRVLDLTQHIAGPYCTKLMAGLGAEVIKVEPPEKGDPLRSVGPFYQDKAGIERSIPFLWLNTGKKSIVLDLQSQSGIASLRRLVAGVDILIESFAPGTMSRLDLEYESLRAINPSLIMTSISHFGQTGPYSKFKADETQLYAMSGLMHETGDPDRAPLLAGTAIAQHSAALSAYVATAVALLRREQTGRGQHVDVSTQEASLINIEMSLVNCLQLGQVRKRNGDHHVMVPWEMYKCLDGEAAIVSGPMRHWRRAAEILDDPRLFERRFDYCKDRMALRAEFEALLKPCVAKCKRKNLFREGQKRKLAFSYMTTFDEVLESPQHLARGLFVEIDHPEVGRHRYVGPPFRLSETPWRSSRAPMLGEHNDLISSTTENVNAGFDCDAVDAVVAAMDADQPLNGIRVVDFTHEWAGPVASRVLADYGAEVIKVEYSKRLCVVRGARRENGAYDQHPMWHQVNRNRLSITLDLDRDADLRAFKELVRGADLVVNNSRGGVMDRRGLGYEDLRKIRPDIILASLSGFGATGPYAGYAGFGGTIEPLSGLMELTAYEPDGKRVRVREMDVVNGLVGACAIMTALLYRRKTGRGQWIDLSQMEAATHSLMGSHLLAFVMNEARPVPIGNRHVHYAPQGCYPCDGDDKWVTITIRDEEEWRAFSALLGHPNWATDPKFDTPEARWTHHDELDAQIERWTRKRSHTEAMAELQAVGVPAGAVLNSQELCEDRHLKARGYFIEAEDDSPGLFPGMQFRLSDGAGRLRTRGPDLGSANEYVFREILGRPHEEVPTINENEIGTGYDSD